MTKLYVAVGLPASGKSHYAKVNAPAHIVSSDTFREQEYGVEAIQGDNSKLFDKIHAHILSLLDKGIDVWFDATNTSAKNRIALLNKIPKNVFKVAYVFATPYETCLHRNLNRARVVPVKVIERYWKSFTMPQYAEGWDDIEIVYSDYSLNDYSIQSYMEEADSFQQDNHHHEHTLGKHSRLVGEHFYNSTSLPLFNHVGLLHDNGKRYTKVFNNMRGEPSDIAHYYGHENCGAYEAMFYLDAEKYSSPEIILGCGLIQYHMRPYMATTEKAKEKLKRLIGEDFYNYLMLLHEADVESH